MNGTYRLSALALALLLIFSFLAGCSSRQNQGGADTSSQAESLPPVQPDLESAVESASPEMPTREESEEESEPEASPAEESTDPSEPGEISDESVAAAMSTDFSTLAQLDGETKGWGSGGGGFDDQGRPVGPVAFQDKFAQYDAYFLVPDSQDIYLTFDEGYEYGFTPAILDCLKEADVKAVFFITGHFAKSEPDLVRRIIDEGHVLGNHSDKHKIYPDLPLSEAARDLLTLHEYVKANFGYEMSLFRFPEGKYSEQTLALVQSLGYKSVFWSFAYKDYDVNDQPLAIDALDKITRNPHPGAIYLLHAVSRTNSEVLPEVIEVLQREGYTLSRWDR